MALIECKLGSADVPVGNENYLFSRDERGRFVAEVVNLRHVAILLGLPAYREVLDEDEPASASDDAALAALQVELDTANGKLTTATADITRLTGEVATLTADNLALTKMIDELTQPAPPEAPSDAPQDTPPVEPPKPDDLTKINGIGDATAAKLVAKGILTFAQLAALTAEQMAALDTEFNLKGLSERSQWTAQAKAFADAADKPA